MFVRPRSFARQAVSFASRRRIEARLRNELQLHADLMAADHLRHGVSPAVAAARRAADADLPERHRGGRAWLVLLCEAFLSGG